MKTLTRVSVVTLASLTATLFCLSPASAQPVTGDIYLDNLAPGNITGYSSWATATITSGPTGLTVDSAGGYGSLYYALPTPLALDSGLTTATLVMTVNTPSVSPAANDWLGIPFILGDNSGGATYGGYAGMYGYGATASPGTATWNGNTVTETVTLGSASVGGAAQLAAIQGGGDFLYGFNLELDPAVLPAGSSAYNVTFNSLTLSTVPEPSSLSIFALGAVALVFRRRQTAVLKPCRNRIA